MKKYSVLMSLYKDEKPENFETSLNSVLNQSIKPNQIVLVIDGPIGYELQSVINRYLEYLDVVT